MPRSVSLFIFWLILFQNLYDLLNEEKKVSQMEILEELLSYGGYLVATSEASMRGTRCSLFQKLSQVRSGLVVGNVKKQNVFPYTKFREENRNVEMGYYFGSDGGLESEIDTVSVTDSAYIWIIKMKRKLKITYGQLEATQERVSVFRNALENMDSAIEMFQNILSEQQSDAITALLEDGRDLRDEMELLHGNLQELENMLSGYIHDMTALVMPKSWDSMMLVDRNDIWVNMKQIRSNVSDTEQVIWGGALQHYKDVHTHIPKATYLILNDRTREAKCKSGV